MSDDIHASDIVIRNPKPDIPSEHTDLVLKYPVHWTYTQKGLYISLNN